MHCVDELIPVAVDIQQRNGLGMDAEELPAEHLEELLEGAGAARHGDERVSLLNHGDLALVHGIHDVEGGLAGVDALQADQLVGDHAVHKTASVEGSTGDGTHQAGTAATVDHADIVLSAEGTQLTGTLSKERIITGTGAAIDGEIVHSLFHGSP